MTVSLLILVSLSPPDSMDVHNVGKKLVRSLLALTVKIRAHGNIANCNTLRESETSQFLLHYLSLTTAVFNTGLEVDMATDCL